MQVYDYTTNTAGFAPELPHRPRSRPRPTEHLQAALEHHADLQARAAVGFKEVTVTAAPRSPTSSTSAPRSVRAWQLITAEAGGKHEPFLGATVISDGIANHAVFVRIRTGSLQQSLTLLLTAYGTAS